MTSKQPLGDLSGRDRPTQTELEEPILAELFSVERLEQHAQTLAAAQTITENPRRGHAVGPRVAENGRVLLDSYRVLARAIKEERSTSSFARSGMISRRTTTVSSPSWPRATSRATRGSWASLGPTSRTRTAASIPRACGVWCVRTSRSSR
jgi:hypothetical protein